MIESRQSLSYGTYLVQLLFPLRSAEVEGDRRCLDDLREELTERFGGVTAYVRAPAVGDWKNSAERVERDEIVIVEVMVQELEQQWWGELRERLRIRLGQDELVIRALPYLEL